jgi:hypothetical protein
VLFSCGVLVGRRVHCRSRVRFRCLVLGCLVLGCLVLFGCLVLSCARTCRIAAPGAGPAAAS